MLNFIKKSKKVVSRFLIVGLLLTSNQFVTLADTVDELSLLPEISYGDYSEETVSYEELLNTDEQSVSDFELSEKVEETQQQNEEDVENDEEENFDKENDDEEFVEEEITPVSFEDEDIDDVIYYEEEPEEDEELEEEVKEEIAEENETEVESLEENELNEEEETDENTNEETNEVEKEENESEKTEETKETETEEVNELKENSFVNIENNKNNKEEIASLSELSTEENEELIYEYTYDTQTINLDFNYGPTFINSTNWVDSDGNLLPGVSRWTQDGPYTYHITGDSGTQITTSFEDGTFPVLNRGSGNHVVLPAFDTTDNAVWEGYKFNYFVDKDGKNMTTENLGTFEFAYQGSGDNTYTAHWSKVSTNNYNLVIDYVSQKPGETTYQSFHKSTISVAHGKNVLEQHIDLAGYTFDSVKYFKPTEATETDSNILLTYDNNGNPVDINSESKLTVDPYTFEVTGAMPNHEVGLAYVYKIRNDSTYKFTVNHLIRFDDGSTELFSDPVINYYNAEHIIDVRPASQSNIEYLDAEVVCGAENWQDGIYALGSIKIDDQILNPSDGTDTSDDKGRFYALMPNQDLSITYYYKRTRTTTPITFDVKKQQEDGTYSSTITVVDLAPSSGTITYPWVLANYENEGYGEPDISYSPGSSVVPLRTLYNAGMEGSDGELLIYVSDFNQSTITIKYDYNYDSSYWGIVHYYALNHTNPDVHGKVETATGSITEFSKYMKKGTYNIRQYLSIFTITPDQNYMAEIYRNKTNGVGEYGEPFEMNDNLDLTGTLKLFIKFVEDPNCWVDINFEPVKFCAIREGQTTNFHIPKGTKRASISFPVSSPSVGYVHVGGTWIDKDGYSFPDIINATNTYYPYIEDSVSAYPDAVKPLALTYLNTNDRGTAYLYAHYSQRKYIFTDYNNLILSIKTGTDVSYGFDNMYPGKTYKIYEALSSINVGGVGDTLVEGLGISDPFITGIPSVEQNAYSFDETNKKINISYRASGVSYALLDEDYNIVHDWTTSPNFTNIERGSYYVIVAKQSTDTISANDDNSVRNGVIVWTGALESDHENHKLLLIGSTAAVKNLSGTTVNGIKVYEVEDGKNVELIGLDTAFWGVYSNNVTLNTNSDGSASFVMPKEDVIIRNYTAGEFAEIGKTQLSVDMGDSGLYLPNEMTLLQTLNTDTIIANAIAESAEVMHYVSFDRFPTLPSNKVSNKLTPYEYSVNVLTEVNKNPYSNLEADNIQFNTVFTLAGAMLHNKNYETNANVWTQLNGTAFGTTITSGIMSVETNQNTKISFTKVYHLNIESSYDSEATIETFIENNQLVTSIPEYSTSIQPLLSDRFDTTNTTSTSDFNAIEYIFEGVFRKNQMFDIAYEQVINNTDLLVRYRVNQDREDAKNKLNEEVLDSQTKYKNLTTDVAKQTILTAINNALVVRNNQTTYTVASINEAREILANIRKTTFDPPIEFTVAIDANEGDASETQIKVLGGAGYNYEYASLSEVTVTREGYNFVHWNTKQDGKGDIIRPTSKVGNVAVPILYAIWSKIETQTQTKGGGNGGGGGAGAGAGATKTTTTYGDVVEKTISNPNDVVYYNQVLLGSDAAIYRNNPLLYYSKDTVFSMSDSGGSHHLNLINVKTNDIYKNQLVSVSIPSVLGVNITYSYLLDANGDAATGFNMVDGNLYYYSSEPNINFGTLQKGLFVDPATSGVYYANPMTGAIVTGWQNIDGYDRYFEPAVDYAYDQFGNVTGVIGYRVNHGKMLVNGYTPDGYYVDFNGVRVIEKPGM